MKVAVVHNRDRSGVINVLEIQNNETYDPTTVEAVANALESAGHNVRVIDGNMHIVEQLQDFMPKVIEGERPGMVFNMAYGIQGVSRYTHVPAMLEMLGVPYVGSGPQAHALALDLAEPGCRTYVVSGATPFRAEDVESLHHDAPAVLRKQAPKLVEDLVPKTLPLGVVVKVLQNLLEEGVPLRDMRSIAETLAEQGGKSQDPGVLTAAVRASLGRLIVQNINGLGGDLPVIILDPALEQLSGGCLAGTAGAGEARVPHERSSRDGLSAPKKLHRQA